MQGLCLLGETSGYVIDAISSKSLHYTLMKIAEFKVDMQNIESKAKDTEMVIRTIEQQVASRMGPSANIRQQPALVYGAESRPTYWNPTCRDSHN